MIKGSLLISVLIAVLIIALLFVGVYFGVIKKNQNQENLYQGPVPTSETQWENLQNASQKARDAQAEAEQKERQTQQQVESLEKGY